ncbi:hypothetical protein O181_101988 [Austropuccinia psidii MF-1]|uniref:Uncharacterized protein n=1 Tax=Austropuccinia psidii MF-1 TaxID=1389203 RepID=A0A9Q3JHL0_9BASI|nr:hypothetical protein [Austropuccinia psidii MF-1]
MESLVLQGKGQKDKEFVKEPKSFIHRPEERVVNDYSFGERRTSSIKKLQTSSRTAQRTSEETERSQEQSREGQLEQTLPTMVQDSQIGTLSHGELVQYGQNPYGIQSQGTGKDKKDFSTQIIDEIRHSDSTINVKLGKAES